MTIAKHKPKKPDQQRQALLFAVCLLLDRLPTALVGKQPHIAEHAELPPSGCRQLSTHDKKTWLGVQLTSSK
eukprot:957598-Pleurochrysis_carterae.AAC.1